MSDKKDKKKPQNDPPLGTVKVKKTYHGGDDGIIWLLLILWMVFFIYINVFLV